ncbi:unnamed protein product [Spirodela intermedia]|uniref:Peroxin-13 n=1 Tax=Spirodela intermedia TaxID=51605 RepID=A0A7I8ILQ1_SPIIN|nr:unnamed protein product [Spirodela intermedia]CAA6657901.1 unnamed protein product [Spirodela intermedia]
MASGAGSASLQNGLQPASEKTLEQSGASSGAMPFNPPSNGSTSEIVEASGTARPGEVVSGTEGNAVVNRNPIGRPVPSRPWSSNYGNTPGGYGSTMNYNGVGYGSGMYGSSYGGYSGQMGGGMYGNTMYRGGVTAGLMAVPACMEEGACMAVDMAPAHMAAAMGCRWEWEWEWAWGGPGSQDPNSPFGGPASPPGFWMSLMRVMHGVVDFFGRIAFLIDQNTFAFHAFMSALLQLFDRSGMLYGELARFALRMLGIRTKPRKGLQQEGPGGFQGPAGPLAIEGPKADGGAWDGVWGGEPAMEFSGLIVFKPPAAGRYHEEFPAGPSSEVGQQGGGLMKS